MKPSSAVTSPAISMTTMNAIGPSSGTSGVSSHRKSRIQRTDRGEA